MVNFDWYRSFVAVYQAGTVTRASALLFLTQPAVSQHISALETALGSKLFERMPRKMIPTDEGKTLYARVISSVNLLDATTNEYYLEKNRSRSLIRIGSPCDFFQKKVLDYLKEDSFIYRVSFGSSHELLENLEKKKLDVVIATKKEPHSKVIEFKKLFVEKFILVQSTTSDSNLREFTKNNYSIPPSESLLLQQNWISFGTDLPIIRRYWREVFKTRPVLTPTIIIPNLSIIAKAVETGKGISILPSYICNDAIKAGSLEAINLHKSEVTNDIWIAYRKEDMKNRNISGFVNNLIRKSSNSI